MVRFLAGFWPIIALAFPVLELAGIVALWHKIGAWTLLWLLADVFLGAALIASERATFMPRMMQGMMDGGNPIALLMDSGLRFMAGVLFIFPGMISDVVALILLLWSGLRPPPRMPPGRGPAANDDVIEGDFRRVD